MLEHHQLYELTRADGWRSAGFAQACDLAVERGMVRDLGLGFYGAPHPHDDVPLEQSASALGAVIPLVASLIVILLIVFLLALVAQGATLALILAIALAIMGFPASYWLIGRASASEGPYDHDSLRSALTMSDDGQRGVSCAYRLGMTVAEVSQLPSP